MIDAPTSTATTLSGRTLRGVRTRWAAVGAAVAVSLGAGFGSGVLTTSAASTKDESVVVAVDPVRIVDTRSGVGVSGDFDSGTDYGLKVTGSIPTTGGMAEVVPDFATGVVLNVTVVRPTSNGFLSVVPATAGPGPYPTSNLNFLAGANTPNSVTVALPGLGDVAAGDPRLGSLNLRFDGSAGASTDVLVDVVAYMTESVVLDVERRLATLEATSPILLEHSGTADFQALGSEAVVESLTIDTPATGDIVVNSSARLLRSGGTDGFASCTITTDTELSAEGTQSVLLKTNEPATLSGTRGFFVPGGASSVTINLVCEVVGSGVNIFDTNLTATYAPVDPETFGGF